MADLSTNYMGLKLKNPVIIGSSGLTSTISEIKQASDSGAGAVVLKSIFEEQIRQEIDKFIDRGGGSMDTFQKGYSDVLSTRAFDYEQAFDYVRDYAKEHTLGSYLKFIEEAKKASEIPVIASINCVSAYDWHYFARRIEAAGADALELNIYILPSNTEKNAADNEQVYFDVVEAVLKQVKIPVSIKVGYYFSSLAATIVKLSHTGIKGLVMFNRPFHPDIDIDTMEITAKYLLSDPSEYSMSLRWMALLSGRVGCNLVASTGIHTSEAAIKQLLAGATAVQMASAIYKSGFGRVNTVVTGIHDWMDSKGYTTAGEFRGKLSQEKIANPADFERVQFMKLYSKIV
jgi:dihydroorotate dehydrogenase (fumarate)